MHDFTKCTVLVVDDTETTLDILVETLGDDYELIVTMDGEDALEIIKSEPPDLILLDIMMPSMDGYEVCRQVKASAITANIPIIFVTAKSDVADETMGFDVGAVDYITKPISPPIVRARVKTHLELKLAREELKKQLDKAKKKAVFHLSHELTTPLAIISWTFEFLSRELQKKNILKLQKLIERGLRNVDRLLDLKGKIDDILNQKPVQEEFSIISVIEHTLSIIEKLKEEKQGYSSGDLLDDISTYIESLYCLEDIHMENIILPDFLNELCDEAISFMGGRDLKIIRNFEKDIVLLMDRNILKKTCSGLLKNAIENTPDEGKIEVMAKAVNGEIRINFHDYGIGITPQNQKMIFGGFFHTQETEFYSSKTAYEFNAGGSGSDLLRIKTFSERLGFSVYFESTRCKFLPADTDICSG
ncbi:MAG: hybrid sensor histidine kinase/response regulator, partial [Desulfobacteraceae bacterium]|nr:hybrid sensor histidine kinase/response regulator [Desulfobacteraceae bacterium]